jgi:LCP family protein required for cell wall assembly
VSDDERGRDEDEMPPDDEAPKEDAPTGDDAPEADESGDEEAKGLGLTEEFARLESEIERETGRRKADLDEGGETGEWAAPEPIEAEATDDEAEEPEDEDADDEDASEEDAPEEEPAPDEPEADPSEDDSASTPPPDSEEVVHGGVPDAPTDIADSPATEHTVVRDKPLAPVPIAAGGYGGPPLDPAEIKDKTPALWWRFLLGSVMIVAAMATAVSLSSLLAINGIAQDLQPIRGVEPFIDKIDPGAPQTILLIGSDKRSNTPGDPGRSDTTMLLRVDADNNILSLFSLPRDLKVDIAGNNYGEAKLNEAFTDGGVKKTLATVKNLTGLPINHVVNVDFQGFADAVDAIGCVYVDVDRDYFNDNSTALSAADQYAAIDVNAGYQRLCGLNALDYVRYRHTDNDFVRAARQQDFLRNARAQVPVGEVLPIIGGDTGNKLLDIFTKYTSSDIRDPADVIGVLKAFIGVRDVPIKEVHFNGTDTIENGIAYVTASKESIQKAVKQFLGEEDTAGGPDSGPSSKSKDQKSKSKGDGGGSSGDGAGANVISAADAEAACADTGGVDKVAAFGSTSARRLHFPVYVPTVLVPGSCYSDGSRQYDIKDTDDKKQPAYKMVVALNSDTAAGEYYGVEGTTWTDPPILDKPSETRTIDGRDYDLYFDGDRLRIVAFHDSEGNSYWVNNTLLQSLDEDQMLAIATSLDEAHG